ncbi:MAG: trigger factor [Mariniphaga sp.]
MKITKTSVDDLNVVVAITIEKQDYEATINETLKDYRKKANMPGFRKGMVPAGLIKKMYGKAALGEEVNKILSRELNKYISEENLNILGEPLPSKSFETKFDFDNWGDFEFAFDLGLSPEINVDFEKIGKLPYYEIIVDEDLIDKQLESYATRFGENIPTEEVGEKETTIGDFVQVDSDGAVVEDGVSVTGVQVAVQLIKDEVIRQMFIGAKVGDVLKFNPRVAYSNDHEVTHLLKVKEDEIEKVDADFNFTINKINTFVPAEINEALIKKVNGEDTELKTVEDFRNKIAADLKSNLIYSSNYRFLFDAKAALTKELALQLPVAFLKRWLTETNDKITAEQIDDEFEHFGTDLEWTLIKNNLAKANGIRVEQADITEMAREMARMQFHQYGMFNLPEEYLDNYAKSILENKEQKQKMAEKIIEDKVLDLIKVMSGVDIKEVTQKEFDNLFEK